ncbi:MAG: 3TM-type holin [bacterium]
MSADIISLIAGGSVSAALKGLGDFAKSIREAITGKAIMDPNKQSEILLKAQEMEHAIILAAAAYDKAQMEAQLAVNQAEAQSSSTFKGGWRPAVGWVCVLGLAYTYLLRPTFPWLLTVLGVSAPPLPEIDVFDLLVLVTGMLGLGGMRSFEKSRGVAAK